MKSNRPAQNVLCVQDSHVLPEVLHTVLFFCCFFFNFMTSIFSYCITVVFFLLKPQASLGCVDFNTIHKDYPILCILHECVQFSSPATDFLTCFIKLIPISLQLKHVVQAHNYFNYKQLSQQFLECSSF